MTEDSFFSSGLDTGPHIHRHRTTSEVVVMLRGRAVQYLYDEQGRETDAVLLAAGVLVADEVDGCKDLKGKPVFASLSSILKSDDHR